MSSPDNWHWIERFSWVAGIVALVATLWQLSRSADERTVGTIDALNKRIDAFHESLGERKKAYEELEKKLVKLDGDHQTLAKQIEVENARRKALEIAARPNVTEATKQSSAAFAAKLAQINAGSMSDKPLSERLKAMGAFNAGNLQWVPAEDRDFLTKSLTKAKEPFSTFKLPKFPELEPSKFLIPKPAEKTSWESAMDFFKKVPIPLAIFAAVVLVNLFKR